MLVEALKKDAHIKVYVNKSCSGLIMLTKLHKKRLSFISPGTMMFFIRNTILRAILFALIWWILTDGAVNSWWVGIPVVLLATWVSILLLPAASFSLIGMIRFVPFFLWQSLRGGIDVAKRALHPKLPISPVFITHRWQLPLNRSRIFMANTVSLLPGTLSTKLDETHLYVHVLDKNSSFHKELDRVEKRVADVFGIVLPVIDCNEE
jgi:multicomponent Na+:H+ antiporter subunit E